MSFSHIYPKWQWQIQELNSVLSDFQPYALPLYIQKELQLFLNVELTHTHDFMIIVYILKIILNNTSIMFKLTYKYIICESVKYTPFN